MHKHDEENAMGIRAIVDSLQTEIERLKERVSALEDLRYEVVNNVVDE